MVPGSGVGPSATGAQVARTGATRAVPRTGVTTSVPSSRCCWVRKPNGTRGPALRGVVNRAAASGDAPVWTDHEVAAGERSCSSSASSLGIAHRSRPPAREAGESTQMSVTWARPATARATSSSPYTSGLGAS